MHPKLIYLYIASINRTFENQGFNFTNDFKIAFEVEKQHLIIEPNYNPYIDLWGSKIQDINLVVGRNGAGKTTLLDFLGSIRQERNNMFNAGDLQKVKWFAIYHIDENKFVIEGYDPKYISNLVSTSEGDSYDYSFYVMYDYKNQLIENLNYIQFEQVQSQVDINERGRTLLNEKMISLYYIGNKNKSWTKNIRQGYGKDYGVSFSREYLQNPKLSNIYKFIVNQYHKWDLQSDISNACCEVSLVDPNIDEALTKDERLAKLNLNLYNDTSKILLFDKTSNIRFPKRIASIVAKKKWTNKQRYILSYLEYMIIDLWINNIFNEDKKSFKKRIEALQFTKEGFVYRKTYLLRILKILFKVINQKEIYYSEVPYGFDIDVIKEFVFALDNIEESLYASSETLSLNMNEEFYDPLFKLLEMIDHKIPYFFGIKSQQVKVNFSNLSTGQMEFINGFSNLYTAVDMMMNNPKLSSILILLDEPDVSFHPEWSRMYIYNLVQFFENVELNRQMKFKLIITTHSPFIVSDVPKEFINCIFEDENSADKRVVKKAEFGLMSNVHDILKSDFFIKSPFGEYAQSVFKKLFNNIEELGINGLGDEKQREYILKEIKEMKGIISAIGETVIRDKLTKILEHKIATLFFENDVDRRLAELEEEINLLRRLKEENE